MGLNVGDGSDNRNGTQVIHSRPEVLGKSWVLVTVTKECDGQDDELEKTQLELNNEKPSGYSRNQAADLIGVSTDNANAQIESVVFDFPNGLSKVSDAKDKVIYDTKEIPSLELNLKRQRDIGDSGTSSHERNNGRASAPQALAQGKDDNALGNMTLVQAKGTD
ncbi:hypothetical protein DITRI_Ditri12bG0083700 [Diplodiscus trichospermus]